MPTIKDVAKACGVSTATVSYVLNGTRELPPRTRERVLHVVREMGYHPSALARGLNNKRLHTLGLLFGIVDSLAVVSDPYASAVLQGVLQAAAESGYNVTIFTKRWRSAALSARQYLDGRTDGILVIAPNAESDVVPGLAALDLPLVCVSSEGGPYDVPSVDVDNTRGVHLALAHLIALGHRRIAHLAGPDDLYSGVMRRTAFREVMSASELEAAEGYIAPSGYDGSEAYGLARQMLALPSPPTAIFAGNDAIALAALAAARDAGVPVPRQLSVIGFDDAPASALVRPALTTVQQPLTTIGAMATQLLVRRMAGETVPCGMTLLEPLLMVRETTAPPPIL